MPPLCPPALLQNGAARDRLEDGLVARRDVLRNGPHASGPLRIISRRAAKPSSRRSRTAPFWRSAGGQRGGEGAQPAFTGGSRKWRRSCRWRRRRTGSLVEPRGGRGRLSWSERELLPPPTGGDGHGVTWGDQGARHLPPPLPYTVPNQWRARAPETADDADGLSSLDSGSPGLVRRYLGVADHA